MSYLPRLRDGTPAPLAWPLAFYRRVNHIIWPLEDDASRLAVFVDKLLILLGFLVFCLHNEVDFHYLLANSSNIDQMLTGMPTYLVLVEIQIRGFLQAIKKDRYKKLLQTFYAEIFVTQESEPVHHARIQRQMLGTRINSFVYMMAMFNFSLVPVLNVINNRRDMLYPQVYLFDNTQLRYYIPLLCCNYWVGIIITTNLFGELNVLGELMMHLNARYVMMGETLNRAAKKLVEGKAPTDIAAKYRRIFAQALRRNVELNMFGKSVENEFSFRIFIMFSFSTGLLCAMGFKAYTNPAANIAYIVWFMGKFIELLMFGILGSILYKTTDDLSLLYYTSGWEQVIYKSDNVQENLKLMKLVKMAIQINSRPFSLTGLKYFQVTVVSVLKIIQGAFSYFTFLTSIR